MLTIPRCECPQGVHIATFATISWETLPTSRHRPVFVLSDTFLRTYGLAQKPAPPPTRDGALASLEDINFTKIAIKFSTRLTKDVVFTGVRDLLQRLGQVAAAGAALSISFCFGRLIAKNRGVSVLFDPMRFPRALADQMTRSLLASPPSSLGNPADFDLPPDDNDDDDIVNPPRHISSRSDDDEHDHRFPTDGLEALPTSRSNPENVIGLDVSIEEELLMYDALRSPTAISGSPQSKVFESAFQRHIAQLAGEVGREARHAFDEQLQQQRDVETVALELKMRRLCAEDLQRHLRAQMASRDEQQAAEARARRATDPRVNSFYSESEQARLGFEDREFRRRVRLELKQQLQGQMAAKELERASARQRSLDDDRSFLRRVRAEMDALDDKQHRERDELRRQLTGAWSRDAGLKQLAAARKRQVAAAQGQLQTDPSCPVSPGGAIDRCPQLLRPRTPRCVSAGRSDIGDGDDGGDDFSVGFDIRSVCGD